jgi:hypothetical protein
MTKVSRALQMKAAIGCRAPSQSRLHIAQYEYQAVNSSLDQTIKLWCQVAVIVTAVCHWQTKQLQC